MEASKRAPPMTLRDQSNESEFCMNGIDLLLYLHASAGKARILGRAIHTDAERPHGDWYQLANKNINACRCRTVRMQRVRDLVARLFSSELITKYSK